MSKDCIQTKLEM